MTIKYDYSGKLSGGDETYVDTREGITELVDGLSEHLLYADHVTLLAITTIGGVATTHHLIVDRNVARMRSNSIDLGDFNEVNSFLETTRHLLHVDCNETENEGIIQTVIDVGNSEGMGHSFSIEHKAGN